VSLKKQRLDQQEHQAQKNTGSDVPDDNTPLNHRSELCGRQVSNFGSFGHFGCGTLVGAAAEGQIEEPALRYLDDGALIAQFERFVVFNADRPRQQIGVLALDEEHAQVEGSNYLSLPRHRCAVVRTPGFLQSSDLA
jgi:hypothetical protein